MKQLFFLTLSALLFSCSGLDSNDYSENNAAIIFSENFDREDLSDMEDKFFVLAGDHRPRQLGKRRVLTSSYVNSIQNGLLFGPEKLKSYSVEASFYFYSTENNSLGAALGGGGQSGFLVQLAPKGNNRAVLRLVINRKIYDYRVIKMIPDTWYRLRLDVKQDEKSVLIRSTCWVEGEPVRGWMIKREFPNADFSGQIVLGTNPRRHMPMHIDDIIIRQYE